MTTSSKAPRHEVAGDETGRTIRIRGARQNNLKGFDLDIPVGEFTVVTGLSGSGKSSLAFETLYAEGQRRYVETFSPYARQFLDRMNRPHVDAVEGVPPAIAIDRSGSVRTSRSTVGTMTELNDHLKLLFAHEAELFCPDCGVPVPDFNPDVIWDDFNRVAATLPEGENARLYVTFAVTVPKELPLETALSGLSAQGFTRIVEEKRRPDGSVRLVVAADRFKLGSVERSRALDAIETALDKGIGETTLYVERDGTFEALRTYRRGRVCPSCGRRFSSSAPNLFSFNSAVGACKTCRGFGRIIEPDMSLVIPDPSKTLAAGCIRPWQTKTNADCQADLLRHAKAHGIDVNTPFEELSEAERTWVVEGDPDWSGDWKRQWYGVRHYFEWLETKSYKMHVRVLLSRYRSYTTCPTCKGSHLKNEALAWRYGTLEERRALPPENFPVPGARLSPEASDLLPGFNFHELMQMPIGRLAALFEARLKRDDLNEAHRLLLDEITARLGFLRNVGLSYLTLDRQGRTLSGGEVERVNLTTALGTNLVNTLFVLDEPSIGLHPRDMNRVNGVLRRLAQAGNTLVVVEHDPQVMLAGNRLVDLGPGAGRAGGEIVFNGTTREALAASTLTADYLSGRKRITRRTLEVTDATPRLTIEHATKHNLKDLTVSIPLGRFVAVAGVSGSGKSTLVADTLVPALSRKLGLAVAAEAGEEELSGTIPSDVVFVDQSPMGTTTRGNPVSYVGAFDTIRSIFAQTPKAIAKGFTRGDFSFNSGRGRCPRCLGSGTEHVEMQFLSDVYLPCPECNGRRYRDEILEITATLADGKDYSIADVLEFTVDQAEELFARHPAVVTSLSYLRLVGLGYLTLGQPLTTLSGGERQRLKLAAHLAEGITGRNGAKAGKLFVFDEPTTGLHFADIDRLVDVFDRLIALGHTVLAIEHNLDVLNTSDWVIELGPEGGDEGGELVFEGTPDAMTAAGTLTGEALSAWRRTLAGDTSRESFFNLPPIEPARSNQAPREEIRVEGAREHNLKNVTVALPRDRFTVVTGPSGSGKSTLAFDIVFAEGQRRYLESLNAYARSMVQPPPVPDVDAVRGIPPTVAIEQRTSRGGLRSTVATMTEIYHFLRLLYVKLGTQYCPDCHVPVEPQSPEEILQSLERDYPGRDVTLLVPLVRNRKGIFRAEMESARSMGVTRLRIDGAYVEIGERIPPLERNRLHTIELPAATLGHALSGSERTGVLHDVFTRFDTPSILALAEGDAEPRLYSVKRACPICRRSFPELDSRLFSYNATAGACPTCSGYGFVTETIRKAVRKGIAFRDELGDSDDEVRTVCPDCHGARLNEAARNVLWHGEPIQAVGAKTINEAESFFATLRLTEREAAVARDAVTEIRSRLHFLKRVGLGYLTLDRSAPTLSGGEAQRIRLAAELGTNLRGVCYVLDEPTIGLHPRDNNILIDAIEDLTRKGNTLLVVEHDEETIRRADHVLDIGPGAGVRGGRVVAEGTVAEIEANPESLTGRYLKKPLVHTGIPARPVDPENPETAWLTLHGVSKNNLKLESVRIPLGRLVVVTGVSGSGKSTLSREVLFANASRNVKLSPEKRVWTDLECIDGLEAIDRVLEVDQTPIGKTPRSSPATYVGFFDQIRKVFAGTVEALGRGYTASRFSFNNSEGACPYCSGQGMRTIEMAFLPNVKVPCEACEGKRFNPETLSVTWKGKTIGDILAMEVDEAVDFFASMPSIAHPLQLMQDVGLGYLTIGQPSPTLSGGEAQRIKLVTELAKAHAASGRVRRAAPKTLYVLDEPTVGLHMADVEKLIDVLSRLVEAGNTVLVIEHNLDVAAEADWVIDLGPEGGSAGGRIVGEGSPRDIAALPTHTGKALKAFLKTHARRKGRSRVKTA